MKTALLGWILAAIVAIAAASCLVDRKSEGLACSSDADCDSGRLCDPSGFCVEAKCPSDCENCDLHARTCDVQCTASHHCGSVTCPQGWTCTITCAANNACSDIKCEQDSNCTIACQANGACDQIDCTDACKCDVTCGSGQCGTNSCPVRNGTECEDGNNICTSAPAGCGAC